MAEVKEKNAKFKNLIDKYKLDKKWQSTDDTKVLYQRDPSSNQVTASREKSGASREKKLPNRAASMGTEMRSKTPDLGGNRRTSLFEVVSAVLVDRGEKVGKLHNNSERLQESARAFASKTSLLAEQERRKSQQWWKF